MQLYDHQREAVNKMHNGCILVGGVGSGKSLTALTYYYENVCGGNIDNFAPMKKHINLYIITTARKRDTRDWEEELIPFRLSVGEKAKNMYRVKVYVDSWNNIKKYDKVENAFFIFDEQRLVSMGSWSKSFIKIAKHNEWILLSATPGDTWTDYLSVFIANGYFKNKTEFTNRHVVWSRFTKFPMIEKYLEEGRLMKMRRSIVVEMKSPKIADQQHIDIYCDYNKDFYTNVMKTRFNPETQEPCADAGEVCRCLRKIVNTSANRIEECAKLIRKHKKVIIFYNYNYELDILQKLCKSMKYPCTEWNGHKHQLILPGDKWVYLVQYTAGAEGWNCISTDTVIFYSANYSYKIMVQSAGRIHRLNTPYKVLYFYHLSSKSTIDRAIAMAIRKKKMFNEGKFVPTVRAR